MDIKDWLSRLGLEGLAPELAGQGITPDIVHTLTDADLRELGVLRLGDRKRILAAASQTTTTPITPTPAPACAGLFALVEKWPSVLALPLLEYAEEGSPVLKLSDACHAVEVMVRFLVMAAVAEEAKTGELPESLARQLWHHIEKPSLGTWRGMARDLAAHMDPSRTLLREARAYLTDSLFPLLDGAVRPATSETSFLAVRNFLAHGGGVTRAQGQDLLARWQGPFEAAMLAGAWLSEIALAVRDSAGAFGRLRGPVSSPSPTAGDVHLTESTGSVFLVRDDRSLPLWPLALFGDPRGADCKPRGLGDTAQVYVRRGEVQLEYLPVGCSGTSWATGDDASLQAFQRIFRLEARRQVAAAAGFQVGGFEDRLHKDSTQLCGRRSEVAALAGLLRERRDGVIWLWGKAGMGKSCVVARATTDLVNECSGERTCLYYRFAAGDERCTRDHFLRFATERLRAALGEAEPGEDRQTRRSENPLELLRSLLARVAKQRPVVLVLDGLDELAERDAKFAQEVPLELRLPNVLWLCAGRPERGLPEAFRVAGAIEPFPDGLPRMSRADIREWMMDRFEGPLRKRLLRGDDNTGGTVVNRFIDRVEANAEGLPIYVKYVVADVLTSNLVPDPGAPLPKSLAAYHETLLRRYTTGDLFRVVPSLVAILAVAKEPLSDDELAALLVRQGILEGNVAVAGKDALSMTRHGLSAIASLISLAPDPGGGDSYVLWHHSLRRHLQDSPDHIHSVASACKLLTAEAQRPKGDAAAKYLFRQGVSHLLDAGLRAEALALLTSLDYVKARSDALDKWHDGLAADMCTWLTPEEDRVRLVAEAQVFASAQDRFCAEVEATDDPVLIDTMKDVLWNLAGRLKSLLRGEPGLRAVLPEVLRLAEDLVQRTPENTTYLRDLSISYNKHGALDYRTDPAKARDWAAKTLAIDEHLVALEPENITYLRDLSVSYINLGDLDGRTDPAKARYWFAKTLAINERLVALEPENVTYLRDLSTSYVNLGDLYSHTDPAKARDWVAKGLAIRERLVVLEPENTTCLHDLSVSCDRLGVLDGRTDPAKARDWVSKALSIGERLVVLEPENTTYLRDLSVTYINLSDLDSRTDPAKARDWVAKALSIGERLVALEPENITCLRDFSISCERLGDLDSRTDPTKARDWFAKALAIRERLVALEPENTSYLHDLSVSHNRLGDVDGRTDPAKARDWFAKALAISERLVALEPENTTYLRDLSVSCNRLGNVDSRTDPAKARDWFAKALFISERLVALEPENTTYLRDLSISYNRLGLVSARLGLDEAGDLLAKAVTIGRKLATTLASEAELWCLLANACRRQAWCARKRGHPDAAAEAECLDALRKAEELDPKAPWTQFLFACVHAVRGDVEPALAALSRAVELGYTDAVEADEEKDLEPLHGDPRFQALLADMRLRHRPSEAGF